MESHTCCQLTLFASAAESEPEFDGVVGTSFAERDVFEIGKVGSGPALMEAVRRMTDSKRGRKRRCMISQGGCGFSWWGDLEVCFC